MSRVKVGIVGSAGRMGRANIKAVVQSDLAELAGGIEQPESPAVGTDLGDLAGLPPTGLAVGTDIHDLAARSDVLIEFTSPKATLAHAEAAAAAGCAMVIGTTGFEADEFDRLQVIAGRTALFFARNMSLGVNLLLEIVEQVARATGPDFDAEILEMHHRHKVDAPSGTAKALGDAILKGRPGSPEIVYAREGITGARPRGAIGYATMRGGDVIGDHTAIFASEGERIEISHKASNREIYSQGALRSALWIKGKPAGFYGMKDVLGLAG